MDYKKLEDKILEGPQRRIEILERLEKLGGREFMDNTPWSDEIVIFLNEYQKKGTFHPYTCPGDYKVCVNHRELIATKDGWICKCGKYTQKWANI